MYESSSIMNFHLKACAILREFTNITRIRNISYCTHIYTISYTYVLHVYESPFYIINKKTGHVHTFEPTIALL